MTYVYKGTYYPLNALVGRFLNEMSQKPVVEIVEEPTGVWVQRVYTGGPGALQHAGYVSDNKMVVNTFESRREAYEDLIHFLDDITFVV